MWHSLQPPQDDAACFVQGFLGQPYLVHIRIAISTAVLPIIFIISWELKWLSWTSHVSRGNVNLEFIITSPSGGLRLHLVAQHRHLRLAALLLLASMLLCNNIPIGSMYGIYANIGGILMVNVT